MFFPLFQLAVESNAVIGLRTAKFLFGDRDACYEGRLMISEKVDAAFETAANLSREPLPTQLSTNIGNTLQRTSKGSLAKTGRLNSNKHVC